MFMVHLHELNEACHLTFTQCDLYLVCLNLSTHQVSVGISSLQCVRKQERPHNNQRHRRPMASDAPTNALGALEILRLLFWFSLTCSGLDALGCPFKMVLKMGALQKFVF